MDNMKTRRIIISILLIMMLCTGCGNAEETKESSIAEETVGEEETESSTALEGTIEPTQDLPESDITVPDYLQGEETGGFSEAEESKDGTVYHLSGEEQSEAAKEIATEIEDSINEVLSNKEYYPNITGISVNETCSEFNVTFSSQDITLYENTLQMSLCIVGNKFQLYQGKAEDELMTTVNYIDGGSGEIFFSTNSENIK